MRLVIPCSAPVSNKLRASLKGVYARTQYYTKFKKVLEKRRDSSALGKDTVIYLCLTSLDSDPNNKLESAGDLNRWVFREQPLANTDTRSIKRQQRTGNLTVEFFWGTNYAQDKGDQVPPPVKPELFKLEKLHDH
ncbi:hypothetical protein TEQG_01459 [Trichophyton equinum CBS 127.97]|uniref:Uncharacterized protein n=1 Tax=Trichophyton equinum (strain ATCC MYA-4606 / CBS 127.97) TaxID=559882 RepID=F2PKK5_TRIEC|nr:hypothetical protein TEQG_01459 [Trichophyton equinum CBS 127.97]